MVDWDSVDTEAFCSCLRRANYELTSFSWQQSKSNYRSCQALGLLSESNDNHRMLIRGDSEGRNENGLHGSTQHSFTSSERKLHIIQSLIKITHSLTQPSSLWALLLSLSTLMKLPSPSVSYRGEGPWLLLKKQVIVLLPADSFVHNRWKLAKHSWLQRLSMYGLLRRYGLPAILPPSIQMIWEWQPRYASNSPELLTRESPYG